MELKKKFIGARIYSKKLRREIEINEQNKLTLISLGFQHLFVINRPKKAVKDDPIKPTIKQRSKRGTRTKRGDS
jgi:hypothetical protein